MQPNPDRTSSPIPRCQATCEAFRAWSHGGWCTILDDHVFQCRPCEPAIVAQLEAARRLAETTPDIIEMAERDYMALADIERFGVLPPADDSKNTEACNRLWQQIEDAKAALAAYHAATGGEG